MPLPNFLDLYPLSTVATRMRPVIQAIAAFVGSKGQPLGLAALDAAGKVPMAQLPPLDPTIPDGSVTGAKLAPNLSYTANGAASLSGFKISGSVYSGGTGTTTVPWVCYETTGAPAVPSWNTAGTILGVSVPVSFSGLMLDYRINGVVQAQITSGTNGQPVFAVKGGMGMGEFIGGLTLGNSGGVAFWIRNANMVSMSSAGVLGWTRNIGWSDAVEVGIARGVANNALEVNNGTRGQYGTAHIQDAYRRVGADSPEGVIVAPVGAVYHRTNGGAGTSFYVKESGSGNTGWVAK